MVLYFLPLNKSEELSSNNKNLFKGQSFNSVSTDSSMEEDRENSKVKTYDFIFKDKIESSKRKGYV